MPRGCKLGLGPHSAGSCTGKSDPIGCALGSLYFANLRPKSIHKTYVIWRGGMRWRNVRADFDWSLYHCMEQATMLHWLEAMRVSRRYSWLLSCSTVCAQQRPSLHSVRLGAPAGPGTRAAPPEGWKPLQPSHKQPSLLHAPDGNCSLSKQKRTYSYLHWCDKNSPPNLLKPKA